MTALEMRALLKAECEKVGGLRCWARAHEVDPGHVSRVIAGEKNPGEAVLKPLGLKMVLSYERKK